MKDNIINVCFADRNSCAVRNLIQYDKGQQFEFTEQFGDGTEVQFDDGNVRLVLNNVVNIPNETLNRAGKHKAWVQVIGEDSETTVKTIKFYVEAREKKNDYVTPDDEQTFREEIQQLINGGNFNSGENNNNNSYPSINIDDAIQNYWNIHKDELKGENGYTPRKGTDYYTPQEISEIITTIQNSVSNGQDGIGISNITTSKSNGVTTVTIKLTDDTVKSFTVKDGADGIDGKSAYQLAVEKGYIGTLEEWFDSLKGISPIKGRDYFTSAEKQELINEVVSKMHVPTDGYTPVKGVDYFTAQEIAEFINAVKSGVADGKTPVKGTDYFTSADKQELIQSVIAELPQAESEEF